MQQKVFIGPVEIAGYNAALSDGFRQLGWEVASVDCDCNRFGYRQEGNPPLISAFQYCFYILSRIGTFRGGHRLFAPFRALLLCLLFLCLLPAERCYIFLYSRSFLPWNLDLWLLGKLNRRTIHVYLGSDSRAPYLSGPLLKAVLEGRAPNDVAEILAGATARKLAVLKRIHRWTEVVVENPLSGHLQPGPFVNLLEMGFPSTLLPEEEIIKPSWENGPVVIHAPSHRDIKGSDVIEAVLAELANEGVPFTYHALVGVPNARVRDMLDGAHLVIDQLYSDTPLAGLGTEAASRGCAVVVGGYGWAHLDEVVSREGRAPSFTTTCETLKDDLRNLLADAPRCRQIGEELRRFVETRWNAPATASRYVALLSNKFPEQWWFDPATTSYVGGMGAQPGEFSGGISAMVERFGPSSLGLEDKAALVEETIRRHSPNWHATSS